MANGTLTHGEIEQKETEWSPLLDELHAHIGRMRREPANVGRLQEAERALRALGKEYYALRHPREVAEREEVMRKSEATPGLRSAQVSADALLAADPALGPAAAFREALRLSPALRSAYAQDTGRRGHVRLVKREQPRAERVLEERVDTLTKAEGCSAREAYNRAARELIST